jgi:leader peptidase (prepilin peptidase)/N-methyltransferase
MVLRSLLALLVLPPTGWGLAALLGAAAGSFFNIAIHRLGLYEPIMRPRPRCQSCGSSIAARDRIPILSWLLLRGRCRHCAQSISLRYPLVEGLSIVLALALYARFVASDSGEPSLLAGRFLVYFALVGVLVVVSGVDLEHRIIPDVVTYPAIPISFICGVLLQDLPARDLAIGMITGYALVAVPVEIIFALTKQEVMGYGDAKLLVIIGGLLGYKGVVFSLFAGALLSSVVALAVRFRKARRVIEYGMPFGPFIALGALAYLMSGGRLLRLLLG